MSNHPCRAGAHGRPCNRLPPRGEPYTTDYCRFCWLFATDEEFNRAWGGKGVHYAKWPRHQRRGPSLFRKAANYGKAVYQHWRGGNRKAGPMTKRFRLALCETCEVYFDLQTRKCSHIECGCNMDCKAGWAEQKCPIGRWPAVGDEMDGEFLTVPDFFEGAEALRAAFEAHFRNPDRHSGEHQVWNYWNVPDLYCYLRTHAAKIMPLELTADFLRRINEWAKPLGVHAPAGPWLSLYVNGMGQSLHNDANGGRFGYVYSLTRWEQRSFTGGETIIMPTEQYWGTERTKQPQAGTSLYHRVPALFGQLLVFDDRLIHGVERVQGTMGPLAGRVVLHGHLVPAGQ